jgi:GNAT superfamily N-acetyltransferase
MANFCLPRNDFLDFSVPSVKQDNFEYKFFYDKEIASLYDEKGFDSALDYGSCLSENPKIRKDKIALVAYVDDKIVGIAACTDDCDSMWQIGIDVLPEFRGKNIASFLVNKLSHKIFEKGKIPYYCTAWSNISSRNTAIKAGFKPAWVEIASVEW